MTGWPARDEAMARLREHVTGETLLRHSLAVEGVMRHLARKAGEDEEAWGVAGLLHDIDFERYPDAHLAHAADLLAGCPDDLVRAVLSHGYGICTDVEPVTLLEKYLFTMDELTGLVAAAALVRPSRSVLDLPVKSVRKKWKDKAFAAGVDRSVIERGAAMLGVELDVLIGDAIEGMRAVADDIGLKGNPELS